MLRNFGLGLVFVLAMGVSGCADDPLPRDEAVGSEEALEQVVRPSGAVHWPGLPPESHDYVNSRLDQIDYAPTLDGGVLFIGDSITDGAPLYAMFPNLKVANHGISWDTTQGVLLRMEQIKRHNPDRIFMMIGTNDTNYTDTHDPISDNILEIVDRLASGRPDPEIYVVSILPRGGPGNVVISAANNVLKLEASKRPFVFLDLAQFMRGANGEMDPDLSYDNLHLNVHGYSVWERALGDCVWNGCPAGLENLEVD